ncbi:MAG: hypothetical protein ACWA41_04820 [Putridiphycobacter sp.]
MSFALSKLKAFIFHFAHPFLGRKRNHFNKSKFKIIYAFNFLFWLTLMPIKFLEIFGFGEFLNLLFKSTVSTRSLSPFEQQELKLIFGNNLNFNHIRVNTSSHLAKIGAKISGKKHLAFVWMKTINFSRPINCEKNRHDMDWLVHEAVHILQYQKLGIQYIFEALLAQNFGGYHYGNFSELNTAKLSAYNLEQQADIVKDAYCALKNQKNLQLVSHIKNQINANNF